MKILISQIAILLLVGQIITNSINNSNVETQTIETQTIDEHSDDFCGSYECVECDKKYNVDNQFEKEDGKCKNYCDICENPQYEYGEDKIHMDELLKEVEEEKVEYVYEEEEEMFTDEEIRNAYYNIPNFKETFNQLRDIHEGLDIVKSHIPRGSNWEWEAQCVEKADEYAREDVEKIQVQGDILKEYKSMIICDCIWGCVPSDSDATKLAEQIWNVICDIEIPHTTVKE